MSDEPGADGLLTRLRDYRRTLEAFSRIGAEALPPERLLHHVVAQVARVTHIERTKVMRYRPENGDLLIEAGIGWKPGVVGRVTLGVDYRSPAGRAFQTAAPVVIQNREETSEFRFPQLLRDHNIISLLNVPIMINGRTWGVLEVDSVEPSAFDEWDISFLATLADMLGTCLALHESARRNVEAAAERARERAQADIAVRELQHRIKNNLQIIVAFLATKVRESPATSRESLNSVIERVQAIALAHDMLSIGKQQSTVEFGDYLRSLCANIDPQRPEIEIEVDAEPAQIPIDRAVPAGLVVNELVTNSLKYAFGNSGGRISVTFRLVAHASEGCLSVEDNGRGMELPPKKGFGLTLVHGFAQQIQGRVEFTKVETGSRVVLCFPVVSGTISQ
jgi:two-component sensor histidine kinase/putative methionine-R-sulfoxide reductase with GAF domain